MNMLRGLGRIGALSGVSIWLVGAEACVTIRAPSFMTPAPRREWPARLELAQHRAAEGRFDAADSVLAIFAARFAGTPEALETAYWRSLYKLDPTNRSESVTTAMAFLDAYIADVRPRDHSVEAVTLRRIATRIDALAKATVTTVGQKEPSATGARAGEALPTDAEVKRLKDELAKANAELERIRRRLMQPPRR